MMKHTGWRWVLSIVLCVLLVLPLTAAERWSIGLTANDLRIEALVVAGPSASAPTLLLIGGLQGSDASSITVNQEAAAF
jgi:hypothetical protein